MDYPNQVFLAEKTMGLFWILVQQVCFSGSKCLYESLVGFGGSARSVRKVLWGQAALFGLFALPAFERELGIPFLSRLLLIRGRDFYPWAIRVVLCTGMILFDALIVLYIGRLARVYRRGAGAVRATLPGDMAVAAVMALLCVTFVVQSISTTLTHNLSPEEYLWMERSFIPFCNFFYVPLESLGAIMLFRVWRRMRAETRGGKQGGTQKNA